MKSSNTSEMRERTRIGSIIRQTREARSWSRQQLANKLECSQQAIYNYETAKRPVAAEDLSDIAAVLGIPITSFFEEPSPQTVRESRALYAIRRMDESFKDAAVAFLETVGAPDRKPQKQEG